MNDQPHPSDIILGLAQSSYPHPEYRLTKKEQAHHGLIWGTTGTGKSRLLQSLVLQHINKGNGVCLLDPHGDLAEGCLSYLVNEGFFRHPDAYEKLVYIEFRQGSHVPFNVFNTPHGPHTRAWNTFESLCRTWPELRTAPLFQQLFLSSAVTLIANDRPITDLSRLLTNDDFRASCLEKVTDDLVLDTFSSYGKSSKGQAASTLRRAFLLSFSPLSRGSLGQSENVFNIRQMMDSGTSLIVNLGSITDETTRKLMGSLIMVQIEQAAMSRDNIPAEIRRPWTCFVDEWPKLASNNAETLENVLTQARKYNLRLYLAAQYLAQGTSKALSGALGQCHLNIAFRLDPASAQQQAKTIAHIVHRNWFGDDTGSFIPRGEQMEMWVQELKDLPAREAFVKVAGEKLPVRITTLTVPDPQTRTDEFKTVLAEYRRRYQRPATPDEIADASSILAPPDEPSLPDISSLDDILGDPAAFFGETDEDDTGDEDTDENSAEGEVGETDDTVEDDGNDPT